MQYSFNILLHLLKFIIMWRNEKPIIFYKPSHFNKKYNTYLLSQIMKISESRIHGKVII